MKRSGQKGMNASNTPGSKRATTSAKPATRRVLEELPSEQRTTSAQADARSLLVRRLRIALPVMALMLIGAFFLNTTSNQVDEAFLEDFAHLDAIPQELEMTNTSFAGINKKGQPFEITVTEATRTPTNDEILILDKPRAITSANSERSVVSANNGLYVQNEKILELENNVTFEHAVGSDNYVLRTPAATVLIDEDRVESDQGVMGEGPGGNTLSADRMKAYQSDGRIVFQGNVKLKILTNKNTRNEATDLPVKLRNADANTSTNGSPQ